MAVDDHTALTSNFIWPSSGGDTVVTYALNTSAESYWDNHESDEFVDTFSSAKRVEDVIRDAFWKWEGVGDVQLVQVDGNDAMINIGLFDFRSSADLAQFAGFAYFPSQFGSTDSIAGDIFIDQRDAGSLGLWLHEIGHALGLEHPHEGTILNPSLDRTSNTVMSYEGPLVPDLGYLDADALEAMYGGVQQRNQIISKYEALNAPASLMMEQLRDYDGNLLGSFGDWKALGSVDAQLDGDNELIMINTQLGRWATLGPDSTDMIDFNNHGEGGDTRVVGIYIDPLVESGDVERGSDFDSQQRFQNDLFIDNLVLLCGGDYDNDGFQNLYFRTADGTAFLNALMHADGNIRYANYQNEDQMKDYVGDPEIYDDWLLA